MAWLYKRGGVWWIGWRHNGKQYLRSSNKSDRKEAALELQKIEALDISKKTGTLTEEYFQLLTGKAIAKVTLEHFLQAWLKEAEANTAPITFVKYQQVVREFSDFLRVKETGIFIDGVTTDDIRAFLAAKRVKAAVSTVKGFRRILSSIFIRAQNEGKIRSNPVALAKIHQHDKAIQKRPFTLSEIRDLHNKANPFWQFMITTGFFTGQRMGDLVTLRREAVDFSANVIRLTSRKTNTRVTIPMASPLRNLLDSFSIGNPDDFYWPNQAKRYIEVGASAFSQEFNELLAAIGLVSPRDPKKKSAGEGRAARRSESKLGFHNFRHTFITLLKASGAMDSVAKELAGHRSSEINTHYTHIPVDTLAKAIDALPTFGTLAET